VTTTSGRDPVTVGLLTIGAELTGAPGAQEVAVSEAAVQYVNDDLGGIGGRPLRLVVGEELADVERARECAERFVAEGAVVVFGLGVAWAEGGLPVLEAARVPWLGAAINAAEATSPVSFPLIGGVPAEFAALAHFLAERGAGSVVAVAPELPQVAEQASRLEELLGRRGIALDIRTVPTDPDSLARAARDTRGAADVVMPLLGGQEAAAFMTAAHEANLGATLVFVGTAMDDAVFDAAGPAAEGTIHCAEFLPYDDDSDEQVGAFREALARYCEYPPTSYAQGSFGCVVTIRDIGARIGPGRLDGEAVIRHLRTVRQPVFMSSDYSHADAPPEYPQLGNVDCLVLERRDGRLVDVGGGWINGWG